MITIGIDVAFPRVCTFGPKAVGLSAPLSWSMGSASAAPAPGNAKGEKRGRRGGVQLFPLRV